MNKFLTIVVLCLIGATLSKAFNKEEAMKDFMEKAEACRAHVSAKPADIDEMIKKQPASSAEGKCLRACLMKKYGVMDDNNKFVKAVGLGHIRDMTDNDPEKMKTADEIANICEAIAVPDDQCEAAEAYGKCFKEQAVAHGIDKTEF